MAISIREALGDNYNQFVYGQQQAWADYQKQLNDSGFVPNENDGLIDSFQSGLWGSTGGLLGGLAGWAREQGYNGLADWSENEAKYAGKRAMANAYTGKWEEGNYLGYALNQGAQAIGSSVPSLAGDALVGTLVGGPLGTAVAGVKWAKNLYNASTMIRRGVQGAKIATGIVAGGMIENASNAGDTYMTGLERNMSHKDAYNAMTTTFDKGWAPATLNFIADKVSMRGGLGTSIASAMAGNGGKVLAKGAGISFLNATVGAAGEGATEAWQQQIQEQALKNAEYDGVSIYNPSTWTKDMKDQAFDASIGALPLGLISGAGGFAKTSFMKEKEKQQAKVGDIADTASVLPSTVPMATPVGVDESIMDDTDEVMAQPTPLGFTTETPIKLDDESSLSFSEQPKGDYDSLLDSMTNKHIQSGMTRDEVSDMHNKARVVADRISSMWDESDDKGYKYRANDFAKDFMDIGYTQSEARKLSKAVVDNERAKRGKEKEVEARASLLSRANDSGYELNDVQREALETGTMPRVMEERLEHDLEKHERKVQRENEQENARQTAFRKRQEYDATYNDSVNKGFLEETFSHMEDGPEKEALLKDTRAIINDTVKEQAREERAYQSGSKSRKPKGIASRLTEKGINQASKRYTKEQERNIKEHVKAVADAKAQNPDITKEELRNIGVQRAKIQKANSEFIKREEAFKQKGGYHDPNQKGAFYNKEATHLVELGKNEGVNVQDTKAFQRLPKKFQARVLKQLDPSLSIPVTEFRQPETKVSPTVAPVNSQTNANTVVNHAVQTPTNTQVNAETISNPQVAPMSVDNGQQTVQAPQGEKVYKPTVIKTKANQEKKPTVQTERKKESKPKAKAKHREEAVKVFEKYSNGEISKSEALASIGNLESQSNKSDKEHIKRIARSVNLYTNEDGTAKAYTHKKETIDSDVANYIESVDNLQKSIEEQAISGKEFKKRQEQLRKQLDRLYTKHPSIHITYPELDNIIPQKSPYTKRGVLDGVRDGTLQIQKMVVHNLMYQPGKFKKSVDKWLTLLTGNDNMNLSQSDYTLIARVSLKQAFDNFMSTYESPEKAMKDEKGRASLRQLAFVVATSFPTERFGDTKVASLAKNRSTMIYGSDKGLGPLKNDYDKEKLLAMAKRFYRKEFEPQGRDQEFMNVVEQTTPKKEDGRKNNGKAPLVTLKSMEDIGDDMAKFTLAIDPNSKLTAEEITDKFVDLIEPYVDSWFIDTDVNDIQVDTKNGTITFEGSPLFSGRDFSKSGAGDTTASTSSIAGRAMVLMNAIDLSPVGVINVGFEENTERNVESLNKFLNSNLGEGKYAVIEDLRYGKPSYLVYSTEVYPTAEELKEEALDDYFDAPAYQFGKDEDIDASDKQQSQEFHDLLTTLTNNYEAKYRLSDSDLTSIQQSFNTYLKSKGATTALVKFLKEGQDVYHFGYTTREGELDFNALADRHTGRVEFAKKGVKSTSSAPLHEVVHLGIDAIAMNRDMKRINHPLWGMMTNTIIGGREVYEQIRHQLGFSGTDFQLPVSDRGGVLGRGQGDSLGGNASGSTSHQRSGESSVMLPISSRETAMVDDGGHHHNSETLRNGSNISQSQEQRLQNGGMEETPNGGRNDSERNSRLENIHKSKSENQERILRRWDLARKLIEDANQDNIEKIFEDIKDAMSKLHRDQNMYHTVKAHGLISLVDAMIQIDIKLGTNKKLTESNVFRLLTGVENGVRKPNRLMHETFAYASHTFMSGDMQKSLFDSARKNLDKDIIRKNQTSRENSFVHAGTMSINRLKELLGIDVDKSPGIGKKSVWAGSLTDYLDKTGVSEIEKYKPHVMILKKNWHEGIRKRTADGDMYSGTDRNVKGKITKSKKGEKISFEEMADLFEEIIGQHNGRAGTVGDRKKGLNYFVSTATSNVNSNEDIRDHEITNRNLLDNGEKIIDLIVQLNYEATNDKGKASLDKLPTTRDKFSYIMGAIDSDLSEKKSDGRARINGDTTTSKILRALVKMSNTTDREAWKQEFYTKTKKHIPEKVESLIKQLHRELSHHKRSMTEIKAIDYITPDMVSSLLIDESKVTASEAQHLEDIKKRAKELGIPVRIKDNALTLSENVANAIDETGDKEEVLFQRGKEDPIETKEHEKFKALKANPIVESAKELAKQVQDKLGHQQDNLEIRTREVKDGNIAGWWLKKWFASPIRMIAKHIPQAKVMVKWAEEASVEETRLGRLYQREFSRMKDLIGNETKSFEKLIHEITDLGRDFHQTVAVKHGDRTLYLNISKDDIFSEHTEEATAKQEYNELKSQGKKVFMDFNENKWRVIASDTSLNAVSSYSTARQQAKEATLQAIKEEGYSDNITKAYQRWINLREQIYSDSVKAWKESGQSEELKPKLLWGYAPMLHGRYGVYKITDITDDKGNTYAKYDKIASFKTFKDAKRHASQFKDFGGRFAVVQHGSRFDDARTASDIFEQSYDANYDTIVDEIESPEEMEARFKRISHSYPMIGKVIDELMTKGQGLNREQFISLLEDREQLAKMDIDKQQLEQERTHAQLDELFRLKPTVGKLDIQKHLLLNYGNHKRDKFNNTRINAKGANPDVLGNMDDYLRYKARYLPTSKFYYKATALYRDITGRDYASQFGRNGEGARTDAQGILNHFISSVSGVPNGFDRALNQMVNDVIGTGWVREWVGDTATTDAINLTMQATSVLKLGMFRPTAVIAQLGALMNVVAFSGFNQDFAQVLQDATMYGKSKSNVSLSEKKMFHKIGLNREDTALETQALMNNKSIYNMKVAGLPIGKFLEKSMVGFNATDKYTRRVAALWAYRNALKEGKTNEQAIEVARDFVTKTNFDYSDKDASRIFTQYGSIGKLFLQFKKYPVKEMELMMDIIQSGDKKTIARFFGSYLVMAGMMGVPVAGAGDELAEWITGKSPTKEMKKLVMEWAGKDPMKKQLALIAMYGAPALGGVDFSRNIGLGDLVDTNIVSSPSLSTINNVYSAFRDHESANAMMLAIGKELTPAFGNYYQALTGQKYNFKKGVSEREYSSGERVSKALGFRPIRDSVESDTANILRDVQKAEKEKRQRLIAKYLEDPTSVSKQELHKAGIKGKDIRKAKENLKKSGTEKTSKYITKNKQSTARQTADAFMNFEEDL